MENNNAVGNSQVEIVNERLKAFRTFAGMVMPETIDFEESDLTILPRKNHAEVTLELSHQFMMEDITDILAERIEMHVLHADHNISGKDWRVVGFTRPTTDGMFLVFMKSDCYGIVERLTIDFYDSLETMLSRIRELFFMLDRQAKAGAFTVLERMKEIEIWKIFN